LRCAAVLVCCAAATVSGQSAQPAQNGSTGSPRAVPVPTPATEAVSAPPDYLIGAEDVLTVVFWREKDMSGDVAVRPDGRITLPLVNEIQAAGLTPEQLRVSITEAANKYLEAPTVSVIVKQINSRKVFITGQVAKQGVFPLTSPTTVVQLITMAGGLLEYADDENITIVRTENGRAVSFRFNYDEVKRRKNLQQNIELKPGDQIIVP
jgi:polysaccharide export outer membrane protein